MSSMKASIALDRSTRAISRALERLSSGKRVNSSRDDPSAFSMGVTLESEIRGLTQGIGNINSSLSALNVADSAIGSQVDLVQRMRELAIEAANATLSQSDRTNLNDELQSLIEEYQRIVTETQFNGQKLLDGSVDTQEIGFGNIEMDIDSVTSSESFKRIYGTGSFQTRSTYLTGGTGGTSNIGDLDGDGDIDLVTSTLGGLISVFFNNGTGSFTRVATLFSSGTSSKVLIADTNRDGIQDLIQGDLDNMLIRVWTGHGNGQFDFRGTSTFGTSPLGAGGLGYGATADFNEDGILDLVMNDENSQLHLALGKADGTFLRSSTLTGMTGSQVQAVDLDGDGNIDIASANGGTTLNIRYGKGNGEFEAVTTQTIGAGSSAIQTADINNDGILDIVSGSNTNASIILGTGNRHYAAYSSVALGGTASDLRLKDMNNDNFLDIVSSQSNLASYTIAYGDGNGSFGTRVTVETGNTSVRLDVADLNGDGVFDVITNPSAEAFVSVQLANTDYRTALTDLRLDSQSKSQLSLHILDNALRTLNDRRSEISALHSRLDSAASSSYLLSENLQEAKSIAIDADIAQETAELVGQQILQQSQIAVMAQANIQLQTVVQLLKFN